MRSTGFLSGIFTVLAVFLLMTGGNGLAIASDHESSGGVLDGKTFMVKQGEKGEEAKGSDTLIFKDGKFRSMGCDKYGFGEAPYKATVEGDTIKFVSDTTSESKGKIHWEGTVQGDKIDATYVWIDKSHWYKPNPKPLEKWSTGELSKSEGGM